MKEISIKIKIKCGNVKTADRMISNYFELGAKFSPHTQGVAYKYPLMITTYC